MPEEPRSRREGTTSTSPRTPTVFVADPSAEAERIADTLRSAGYSVVDVPLSMLASRASVQKPNVVLLDVDAEGALEAVHDLRHVPGTASIDFIYFGSGGGRVTNTDEALQEEGSAFFLRPVDIGGLVRRVEALTGGPTLRPEVRPSTPPPSLPKSRQSSPSLPMPGARGPSPSLPMSTPSLADLVEAPRSLASFGAVSNELSQLLAEAELRAEIQAVADAPVPTPEEEIESVLPADVLASLDEPIGGDDDDGGHEAGVRTGTGAPERDGTGAHGRGTTAGGTRSPTTGSGLRGTGAQTFERRPPNAAGNDGPPRTTTSDGDASRRHSDAGRFGARTSSWSPPSRTGASSPAGPARAEAAANDARDVRGPSVQPGDDKSEGTVLGTGDARRFFASAVARRASGALCFEEGGAVRRIVLRDGDLVTAASGAENETLVHFLAARGELPRDEALRLADKIPPYGRHAGAALVAHGWLRQDQLWTALRGHAEWIGQAVLRLPGGTARIESEPPGKLRGEPSVFGASTGSEIFVELVRRAISPDEAIQELGGSPSRLGDGAHAGLLAECALAPAEVELLGRARGGTLAELLARSSDEGIASVVLALALLGVLDVVPAPDFGRSHEPSIDPEVLALDEEAIRARIRARMDLVEEGDYFAILGVAHDATGYEVRRAFLDLRRAFEPSRILTPRLADLAADVRKITVVLEEAYDILRDNARRERYRRAIEARPT